MSKMSFKVEQEPPVKNPFKEVIIKLENRESLQALKLILEIYMKTQHCDKLTFLFAKTLRTALGGCHE
jgi:hypothetical protein